MFKRYSIPYRENNHGDFDAEWLPHKKVSGWWYITGYLNDENNPNDLYSYQYTVLRSRVYGITLTLLQLALTDFQTGKHFYKQTFSLNGSKFFKEDTVKFSDIASLKKNIPNMELNINTDDFSLNLNIDKGKGAFWHGDNGVLIMGQPEDPIQRTVYYSYPNMPTIGDLSICTDSGEIKNLKVIGKSWFDRQWGPYSLTKPETHWEWFSLRFFDNEEVMLFSFPQHPYQDGTYIDKFGNSKLVRNYEYKEKEVIKTKGFEFSKGWDITLPGIKEEKYQIIPIMDGQINLAYYELLADIVNPKGEKVGYCFVELLPGVRNPNMNPGIKNLIKKI